MAQKTFIIKWLDENHDLNVRHFKRYEHAASWFRVLTSLIRAGERLEITQGPLKSRR